MANRSDQFNHTKPIVFNERCVWINAETWMKRYISFQRCYCCCCFINLAVVFQMGYSQERKKNQQPGLFQCGSTVIESLSTSHVHNHFDSINHSTGMVAADSVQIICESLTLTSFFHYSLIHARISLLISLSHPMTKSTPHIWLCEKSCFCLFPVNECEYAVQASPPLNELLNNMAGMGLQTNLSIWNVFHSLDDLVVGVVVVGWKS